MPRNADAYKEPPIVFQRWSDDFSEVSYSVPLTGAFEVTTPLQAMLLEAMAKDKGIVIQAALMPLEIFFGVPKEEPDGQQSRAEASDGG